MNKLPACCARMHVTLRESHQHALGAEYHNCTATAAATLTVRHMIWTACTSSYI
jgi:hypothetical protein